MREENTNVVFKMLFDEDKISSDKLSSALLYSAEDIKQAEIMSYNKGYEQGHTEGFKQAEEQTISENLEQMKVLIANLTQKISELIDQDTLNLDQSTEKIILLTQTIMRKILPNLINTHGISEIEATIRHIFSTFLEKQTLLIHLNPGTLTTISHDLEDIAVRFGKFLNFEQDTKLGLYDCKIEWQGGGALWSQTSTLEKIEEILMDSLNSIAVVEVPVGIEEESSESLSEQMNEKTVEVTNE